MANDYEKTNFNNYIKNLKNEISVGKYNDLLDILLSKSKYKFCKVKEFEGNFYIEKGMDPKIIFHINSDSVKDFSLNFEISEIDESISSKFNINLINSILILSYLITYTDLSFDVLITRNNIQSDFELDIESKDYLRTDKVVNLNLRQGDCLADEFSSLILSVIKVPVKRFQPDYTYEIYRLSVDGLMGGHSGDSINKVRINSIRLIINIFRKMKAKVDLEMVNIFAGDRYDNIPSTAQIDFIINKKYESDLASLFEILKNDAIEKNLKYEPEMQISYKKLEKTRFAPMTSESFNHLASFIELSPSGNFAVNSIDNQVISSSNLATARTLKNSVNMILVFRSLTEESMLQMLEQYKLASKISKSVFIEKLKIPRWKNKDFFLENVFIGTYKNLFDTDLNVIKTQYSLDSSLVFKDVNVKIVSLGVKYKKDNDIYISSINDISKVVYLLKNVLLNLANSKENV